MMPRLMLRLDGDDDNDDYDDDELADDGLVQNVFRIFRTLPKRVLEFSADVVTSF